MDTTTVIPKAKLSSCQRWKPDTLELSDTPEHKSINNKQTNHSDHEITSSTTTEEVPESLSHEAIENGHKQGYEIGYKQGLQEGRQQGISEIQVESNQLNALLTNLDQHIRSIEQHVAQDLLTLAINLTKKMVTQTLTIHPELILPIVQDAIHHLPCSKQQLRVFLNPEDAKIVRQHINEQQSQKSWEIYEDAQLTVGSCRLETSDGEIDASIETRWRRVLETIGQNNDWIEK